LTFRSVIHGALTEEPAPLEQLVERLIDAARTDEQRYRLLHPTITDSDRLEGFWHQDPDRRGGYPAAKRRSAETMVRSRLLFDVGLEMGLTGQVGRTLLLTGSAQAQVRVSDAELDEIAQHVLRALPAHLDDAITTHVSTTCSRCIRDDIARRRPNGASN